MKTRIMFMASSLQGGGAEQVFINIINSLDPTKFVILLAYTGKIDNINIKLNKNVQIKYYNKYHARNAFFELYQEIKIFKPNYIFTSHFTISYFLPLFKIIFHNKFRIILRVAVPPSEFDYKGLKSISVKNIAKILLRKYDLIIAQTKFMKSDIMECYKIPDNKIQVIRNIIDKEYLEMKGCENSEISFDNRHYNIVASGALYHIKGFDILIEAMVEIKKNIPTAQLYILGEERYEIGYKLYLEKLISKLDLRNSVTLLGHKDNPFPFYKMANLFVLSSIKEGFPNVVLEASYYGTPIVATNCVDFTGIIQESLNGYIVEKNSSLALADGVIKAFRNLKKNHSITYSNYNYENIFSN